MTRNTKKYSKYWSPLYPGKTLLKSKGGSIRFSDIQKYLTWLKLQECYQFSWFKITLMIRILNSSVHQKSMLEKWHVSFQIKASHLHIGPKCLCQPEIGYTTPHFFPKTTHPLSDWVCIVKLQWWEDMQNKVNPTQHLHLYHHQHRHQLCLQTGSLHHLCEMSGLIHNMLG